MIKDYKKMTIAEGVIFVLSVIYAIIALIPSLGHAIPNDHSWFIVLALICTMIFIKTYAAARKKYYGKPFTPDILKDGNFELRVAKNDNNSYDNPSFYEIWQPGKQDDSRIVADWGNQFFHDIPRDIFPVYVWIGTKIVKTKQDSKIHIERFRTIELLWDELLDDLKTKKAVKRQYEVSVYKKGDKKTKPEKAKA